MTEDSSPQITPLVAAIVISLAIVGYFTGLQSPMNPSMTADAQPEFGPAGRFGSDGDSLVVPATAYRDMSSIAKRSDSGSILRELKSNADPLTEIRIEPGAKLVALAAREKNRAFNGAPPTIPHPIEEQSAAACIACHQAGAQTATLRIPRMSHQLLTNCTQCHVASTPSFMVAADTVENDFVGLKAPQEGPRAYAGAPPQIPHSTWMRSDCMSCHGYTGLLGLRTTHPWRQNCQQCHAPSAMLEQSLIAAEPRFLAPPRVAE
jgi:cytochrome c-type protein NapB